MYICDTAPRARPDRERDHAESYRYCADQYWYCETLAFNPARVIEGVEINPDDPIIAARHVAYEVGHTRRTAIYPPPK